MFQSNLRSAYQTLKLSVLLIIASDASALTRKVLFIGNSYTGNNNLPRMVQQLAQSTNDTLQFTAHTPGGNRLINHAQNAAVYQKIRQNDWDYVVIQAQSQEPSLSQIFVEQQVYPYAKQLCDSVRANNPCSQPLFYMTWGRENGDQGNCPFIPALCTYEGMDSLLNLRYREMGKDNKADVSPVGEVWHYVRDNHSTIDLYTNDESHPSIRGSYVAACTFYSLIFQKDPTTINNDLGLSALDAIYIRQAAKKVAFDNLSEWTTPKPKPEVALTFKVQKDSVYFQTQSKNARSFKWSFGDGATSSEENPIHVYEKNGSYRVNVTAVNCGSMSFLDTTVIVDISTGVEKLNYESLQVFPNPSTGWVTVTGAMGETDFMILDALGKQVLTGRLNQASRVDASALKPGAYWLVIGNEKGALLIKE